MIKKLYNNIYMAKQIISFCSKSLQQLQRITKDSGNNLIGISVQGGGCNGLKYNIAPREKRFEKDELLQLDGIDVSICSKSLLFIL